MIEARLEQCNFNMRHSLEVLFKVCLLFTIFFIASEEVEERQQLADQKPKAVPHSAKPPWQFIASLQGGVDVPVEAAVPSWVFARERRDLSLPCLSLADIQAKGLFTSQDGEDAYAMQHFFAGRCGGLVLESGALNGVSFSVSNALVRGRGWRAVHVEAGSAYTALVRNRPESLNIHAALCNHSQTLHWVEHPDPSSSVNGFYELMNEEVRVKFFSYVTPALLESLPPTICRPLSPLLGLFAIDHVDLWILDVEGSERMVLEAVDWSRIRIDVIVVESLPLHTAKEQANEQAVVEILSSRGYSFHGIVGRNWWWVRDDFVPV